MGQTRTFTSFIARVIVGIIFIAHGWQKVSTNGIDATAAQFAASGVPMPRASAHFSAWVELIGGGVLILGVLVPLVSLLLLVNMIGAIVYVHADNGFWNSNGGYEFPLALIAALIAVGLADTGRIGGDGLVSQRFRRGGRQ